MLYYSCISIYILILGLLLSMMLFCTVFETYYNRMSSWKIKALLWTTWFYISSGVSFIYLVKGILIFYREKDYDPDIYW